MCENQSIVRVNSRDTLSALTHRACLDGVECHCRTGLSRMPLPSMSSEMAKPYASIKGCRVSDEWELLSMKETTYWFAVNGPAASEGVM